MKKLKSGQTIVEVMVALGMATIALVALAQIASKSVANSGLAKRQTKASYLASQIVENIKLKKSLLGWTGFKTLLPSGTHCFGFSASTFDSGCTAVEEFTNTITVSYSGTPETADITVKVIWNEGGRTVDAQQGIQFVKY